MLNCECNAYLSYKDTKCMHARHARLKLIQLKEVTLNNPIIPLVITPFIITLKVGFLIGFESLLSCYKKEAHMLSDFYHATTLLQHIAFAIVPNDQKVNTPSSGLLGLLGFISLLNNPLDPVE